MEYIYQAIGESEFYGEPYIKLCRTCNQDYKVCIVLQISPIEIHEYIVLVKGVIIEVSKDKQLDSTIEEILRRAKVVKYYRDTVSFYIPRDLTVSLYKKLCGENKEFSIEKMPIEEALIYLGEEDGFNQGKEMVR